MKKEKLQHFDVIKHIHFVPPLNEKEVDKYFLLFEEVAKDLDWPLNKYTILLQSVLKGKVSEVYLALKPEQTSDYQTAKETILNAYELVPKPTDKNLEISKSKLTKPMLSLRERTSI